MEKGVTIFSYSLSFCGIFYTKANDIVDQLTLAYNGNQLKSVNDYGLLPNQYGVKEYQNKSNADDEFAYDKNGNMIKDLDRDIVTIKYNILNLPDTVQFKNGYQIVNRYDASGKKLGDEYYTILYSVQVPIAEVRFSILKIFMAKMKLI